MGAAYGKKKAYSIKQEPRGKHPKGKGKFVPLWLPLDSRGALWESEFSLSQYMTTWYYFFYCILQFKERTSE
ncbi:hypothetical protein OYC64_011341 [Pagothenia borchgrevinki]|uniref:Uncharacterized protein n=1 Tax=Pagothenia borchgrevinki TaxID=8213 RepID=A0ABD2GZ96_PAGBO